MTIPFTASATAADLASGLRFVACAVSKRPPVAVLAGVKLSASKDGITLSAYDYETAATIRIPGSGEGEALVSHARFVETLKAFGKSDVLSMDSDFTDGMHVTSSDFTTLVEMLKLDDYPTFPLRGEEVAMISASAVADLTDVLSAACKDLTMPTLCSVYVATDPTTLDVTFAATDRYRLVEAVNGGAHGLIDAVSAVVPSKPLASVKAMKGGCRIFAKEGMVEFADADRAIAVRTLDVAYPRYRSLIPSEYAAASVTVDAAAVVASIKRLQATMTEKAGFQTMRVWISELGLTLATKAGAQVVIPGKFDGTAAEILISPVYMADALTAAGPGDVTVSYFDPKPTLPNGRRPVLFTNSARPSLTALVMPMNPGAE